MASHVKSAPPGRGRGAPMAPYARVKRYLKEGLASDKWAPGVLMPSESELVAHFGVSRMTVSRALRELQSEGLVDRMQGVGTFASRARRASSTLSIRDIHEEVTSRGNRHRAEVLLSRRERATADLARRFRLAQGSTLFHTLIVHLENDIPIQSEDRFVNPACAPGYLEVDFTRITPTQYLLQVAPLWEAHYTVEARLPSAVEARLLAIRRHDPCLVISRGTERLGAPITQVTLVHPGSRYVLRGHFKP